MSGSGRNKDPFASLGVDAMMGAMGGRKAPAAPAPQQKSLNELMADKRREDAAKSPLSAIKPMDLAAVQLRKVKQANVPQSSGITLEREDGHTGAAFADFVANTRRDLTTLAATKSGQDMFATISKVHTGNSNLGLRIHDGAVTGEEQKNKRADYAQSQWQGDPSDLMKFPGSGSSGDIHHHTEKSVWGFQGVGMSSALALGHEMVHGTRGLLGKQQAAGPLEEKETVGPSSGARTSVEFPTENSIRKDLTEQHYAGGTQVKKIPARKKYGNIDID